jgi:hypothetical protein
MSGNLFGWGEPVWHAIDQIGMLFGLAMGLTWFGGLLFAVLRPDTLKRWLFRNRFPNVGANLTEGERWEGVIFTVSKPELPIQVIRQLRPGHIGLIVSEQSRGSANAILREAQALNIRSHGVLQVSDPDDPAETREMARALLHRLRGAGVEACAVDITGGKMPMSLGAFMAAEETGISTLYLASRYDDKLQKPDSQTSRIHCLSRPE